MELIDASAFENGTVYFPSISNHRKFRSLEFIVTSNHIRYQAIVILSFIKEEIENFQKRSKEKMSRVWMFI